MLGITVVQINEIVLLIIGGMLVTGSANAFNQIVEREYDKQMKRTAIRPIPSGNLSIKNAIIFASIIGVFGIYTLQLINIQCSFFGLLSLLLYILIYTPLKRKSPISIFIGAFPGAIPILLGWVAATNDFGLAAGILFAIQFCWQFPHFIAISWVLDKEYKEAGFKMMIGEEKGTISALVALVLSSLMTFITVIPFLLKIEQLQLSIYGAIGIFVLGLFFTEKSFQLLQKQTETAARKVLVNSYIYLPVMQLIYVFDKFLTQ